jgi:HSP20 family molecular chaperone IbpA
MRDEFDDFERLLFKLARHLLASTGSMTLNMSGSEPYFEYSETDDKVVLTTELPGVRPEDIIININADSIEVRVDSIGYTSVHATPRIKPKEADILYRNGVLEVKVTKK